MGAFLKYMTRFKKIKLIRNKLNNNKPTIGTWIQMPNSSAAEILGDSGYDWIAVDLEHGSIGVEQLPDIFRAIELGGTLPIARLARGHFKDCKQALDSGAGGVIIPMIKNADKLEELIDCCCWPPAGRRGVGFSRANLFGKHFDAYVEEAQSPLFIGQIEHISAVENLKEIIHVEGLDAILVGPYDLSSSMGITGQFNHKDFHNVMDQIISICTEHNFPCGSHILEPKSDILKLHIKKGYRFIAFGTDAVFLYNSSINPLRQTPYDGEK